MLVQNKSIEEVLRSYSEIISFTKLEIREIDLKDKYLYVGDAGLSGIVFCRDGARIYLLNHPHSYKGWYFKSSFEQIVLDAIRMKLQIETKEIFGYGMNLNIV